MSIEVDLGFKLGLLLLSGLIGGKIAHYLHLPSLTGYIFAGLLLGPSIFNIVDVHTLKYLSFVEEVALGLILFEIGRKFEYAHLKKIGSKIGALFLFETITVVLSVTLITFILSKNWFYSFLLGLMAFQTAPASTLHVIEEVEAEGPLTDIILTLTGMNTCISIIIFKIVFEFHTFDFNFNILFIFILKIFMTIILGIVFGILISYIAQKLEHHIEIVILSIGSIIVVVSLSEYFGISYMLTSLFVGITVANASLKPYIIFKESHYFAIPVYVVFFVLAGCELNLSALKEVGMLGFLYTLSRTVGIVFGLYIGSHLLKYSEEIKKYCGIGMLSHAGGVLGLVILVKGVNPELGSFLMSIILSSIIIFEFAGPILLRFAAVNSGEVKIVKLLRTERKNKFESDILMIFRHLMQSLNLHLGFKLKKGDIRDIRVYHIMRRKIDTLKDTADFYEIVKYIEHSKYDHLPVINKAGQCIGIIKFDIIRDLLFDNSLHHLIIAKDIIDKHFETISPNATLEEALNKFHKTGYNFFPVVSPDEHGKLLGMLEQRDVVAHYKK